jgi:hypothetical protein
MLRPLRPRQSQALPPRRLPEAGVSTTREEILAALTEHPEGLTSKELAPLCPACECDPQIVGRTIALLRSENKIHAGTELREGGAIWIFGPEKRESREPPMSLPYRADARPHVSEAARAIAAMRGGSQSAAERPLARAQPAPETREAPARPAVSPQEQPAMSTTIREKIEALLKEKGPMDSRTMRKHGLKNGALSQHLADLVERKILVRLGGGPRSSIYGFPGEKLGEKAEPVETPARRAPKPPKAAKPRKMKKKARAAARAPSAPPKRSAPPANGHANGEPHFAINEHGELGIEVEGAKVRLAPEAFERLRGFIERTKPVWSA